MQPASNQSSTSDALDRSADGVVEDVVERASHGVRFGRVRSVRDASVAALAHWRGNDTLVGWSQEEAAIAVGLRSC